MHDYVSHTDLAQPAYGALGLYVLPSVNPITLLYKSLGSSQESVQLQPGLMADKPRIVSDLRG